MRDRKKTWTYVAKERQHLIVGCIVGNEESKVGIVEDCSYANEARSPTWNYANVLPGILTLFAFSVMCVIQVGHRRPQGLKAGSGAVLSGSHGDIDLFWTLKAALDVIFDFWRPLPEIGPLVLVFLESMFVGSLRAPDHSSGGTRRV